MIALQPGAAITAGSATMIANITISPTIVPKAMRIVNANFASLPRASVSDMPD